ncbi:unnamed protein product, partial [Prorocentrum cordatum]
PVHLEKSTCLRRAQNNQLGRCPPRLARERARAPRAPARAEAMPRPPVGGERGGGGKGRHGERGAGRAARRGGKKMRLPIGWQGCSEDHAPVALYTNYCGTAAPVAHGGHGHRQVFGSPVPHDAGSLGQGMLPGQYCPAEQNVGLHAGPGGYCDGTCTTETFSGDGTTLACDGTSSAEAPGHGHRQVFGSPVPHDAGSLGQGMLPGQYCPAEQNVGLHAGPGGYCDGTCTTETFSGDGTTLACDGTSSAEAPGHGHRQVFGSPVPHDAGSLGQGMLPGQYCPAEQNVGLHAGPGGYCDGTCTTEAFSGVSKPWTRDGTCSAEAQSCSSSVSAATAAPAAAWVAQAKASSARARRAGAILGMVEARAGREWLARVGPW